ncbi:MAG: sulfur carrier protein ThiS [Deltaproteobacteria bacterium]|nr:sulfur carrier protein ThiS [Deltaproteobacteria bacterium]
MSILLKINGEDVRLESTSSLAEYLEGLKLTAPDSGVAVVRNGEIVRRADWGAVKLADGDELEVVRATQGG